MNIKYNTHFLLESRNNKEGECRVRYRVSWNNTDAQFLLGYNVDKEKWSKETQRCKNSTTHGKKKIQANVINREIQNFIDTTERIFIDYEKQNKVPSKEEFRNDFKVALGKKTERNKVDFFSIFDEFVLVSGRTNEWSKGTFQKFNTIKRHLQSFNDKLSFNELTQLDLETFVSYLHKLDFHNTTIQKDVNFVKWFLRWSATKGFYTGNLHLTFKPKFKGTDGNQKEVIHLTWDELMSLYNFTIPENKQYLERVRDVFCFTCFTSLRYSDVAKLSKTDVKPTFISIVTQKTTDGLKIELNKYSKAILEKYKDTIFQNNKALPVVSNQNMNAYLKELGQLAGLTDLQRIVYFKGSRRIEEVYPKYELLTTHCGRRTFIVNALFLGIPAEVVMKWTGHSDFKAMKPYVKIVDELKEVSMKKFDRE